MTEVFNSAVYGAGPYGEYLYPLVEQQDRETSSIKKMLTPLPPPVFTGMKLKGDIRLGSLVLNQTDENNVIWVCTDIVGWWDVPEPQIVDIARGWGDGSYDTSGRWAARDITLNGVIFPPTPEYLPAARDALVEAVNLVRRGAWLMTREDPPKASWVRLSGRPSIETVNARGRTEFSIGLRAADPIKYSWNDDDGVYGRETVEVYAKNASLGRTGTIIVENTGNTDVTVKFEITGPMSAPARIINVTNGQTINIVKPLSGDWTANTSTTAIANDLVTVLVTCTYPHNFAANDTVTISSDSPFIPNGSYTVDSVYGSSGFYITVAAYGGGAPYSHTTTGTVTKVDANEILDIDTYDKSVLLDGFSDGARAWLDPIVDWITLSPGNNTIVFEQTT